MFDRTLELSECLNCCFHILSLCVLQVVPRYSADGDVRPAHVMHVSWSADHRLVDGATIARFSNLWRSFVENPTKLVLELK